MPVLSDIQAVHLNDDEIVYVETEEGRFFRPSDTASVFVVLDGDQSCWIAARNGELVRILSGDPTPVAVRVERALTVVGATVTARPVDAVEVLESTHNVYVGDQLFLQTTPGRLWGTVKYLSTCI